MVGALLEHPDGRRGVVQAISLREQWWALVDPGGGALESWAVSECRLLGPEFAVHVPAATGPVDAGPRIQSSPAVDRGPARSRKGRRA